MKSKKECVAMLLAGGEGKRLQLLTKKLAKPAVYFGGKYRIIDFPLSNCTNSGIDTVGVLTQYQPLILNSYIGIGSAWSLDRKYGGVSVLPPFQAQEGGNWYKGTADAIYQNINFIEQYDPQYVLILSGDHIYKMNYAKMLQYHQEKAADVTISVIEVPWEEASRFGILNTNEDLSIHTFDEKPENPQNNLASMGIYIFNWDLLKTYLSEDAANLRSSHDFGKNVLPKILDDGKRLYAYKFQGYWKDVGTVESLWKANMDLLEDEPQFNLNDMNWRMYSVNPNQPPQYISQKATVNRALINEGCYVDGNVDHSILFFGVHVGEGSSIRDSVIMPNVKIGKNVTINKAIIGENSFIEDGAVIEPEPSQESEITLIGENSHISANSNVAVKS
ncbi:glucose-1-phosphate adenylyltransferase [Anaerobacillus arseniciselenatis]|uniref:Glucose-1-phosphate adenylyltransferase n=1 Tax=Anaerobacillus arseniciselenatis TaxID=85682 RepID=A0A1S2LJK8_9BACI|nr:glucose-1-phosphate adenylyltransferase [Anaerobacillus arseniciselenatis]OIJ11655.1 glucose-1-phosphate adenylyltransferase [Anaerobacillus arseniciselenatis]